jgi:hypothetical protein
MLTFRRFPCQSGSWKVLGGGGGIVAGGGLSQIFKAIAGQTITCSGWFARVDADGTPYMACQDSGYAWAKRTSCGNEDGAWAYVSLGGLVANHYWGNHICHVSWSY